MENYCFFGSQITPKFIPIGPIGNKAKLVQIMAWSQTCTNLLSEPMMPLLADVYASLRFSELTKKPTIHGSMVSHKRGIVGLSQSAPAAGWGSPLHG